MIFFFQAEDGIRDGRVTGVQTCALPISISPDTANTIRLPERHGDINARGTVNLNPHTPKNAPSEGLGVTQEILVKNTNRLYLDGIEDIFPTSLLFPDQSQTLFDMKKIISNLRHICYSSEPCF